MRPRSILKRSWYTPWTLHAASSFVALLTIWHDHTYHSKITFFFQRKKKKRSTFPATSTKQPHLSVMLVCTRVSYFSLVHKIMSKKYYTSVRQYKIIKTAIIAWIITIYPMRCPTSKKKKKKLYCHPFKCHSVTLSLRSFSITYTTLFNSVSLFDSARTVQDCVSKRPLFLWLGTWQV